LRQDRVRTGEIRRQAVAARVHHDLFEILCTRRRDRPCRRSWWRRGQVCCDDGIDARCCLRGAQPVSCEDLGCKIDSAVCLRLCLYAQVRRDQSRVVDEGQSLRAQLIEYVADRPAGERARPFGGMSRTRCSDYRQDARKQAARDQYGMGELETTAGQEAFRLHFHAFYHARVAGADQSGGPPLTFSGHWEVCVDTNENYSGEPPASAEGVLRRKARAAIRAGMLPGQHEVSTWGGPGSGASCAVCGDAVVRDGLGFELEFADADGRRELRHVHIPCYAAWDLERRELLQAGADRATIPDRERVEP
jgi:hypothetical protein